MKNILSTVYREVENTHGQGYIPFLFGGGVHPQYNAYYCGIFMMDDVLTTMLQHGKLMVLKHYINYHDNNGDLGKAIDETYGGTWQYEIPIFGLFHDNDMEPWHPECGSSH